MDYQCYLNGQYLPLAEARISVLDRGFLFGDGIYEVIRVYGGKLFRSDEHFKRLSRSLDGLRIDVKIQELLDVTTELLKRSRLQEATLYLQITRGVSPERRHFFPVPAASPTVFIFVTPHDDASYAELRKNGAKGITFTDLRWKRVDLKTLNLLGNVLAAQAAVEAGVYETLLVNEKGEVTEGSHTNVFAVLNGKVRTYPLSTSVLPGVTRLVVFEAAAEAGIEIQEEPISKEEIFLANEVFISSTTAEIVPLIEIDGKSIGLGVPGEFTRRLQAAFRQKITISVNNEGAS